MYFPFTDFEIALKLISSIVLGIKFKIVQWGILEVLIQKS